MTEEQIRQKFLEENLKTAISDLRDEINKYDTRFVKYSKNKQMIKELDKMKDTKTKDEKIRELVCKFMNVKTDSESLTDALRSIKNERKVSKYNNIYEDLYDENQKIEFSKETNDIQREENLKARKETIHELKEKFDSSNMKKILEERKSLGGSEFKDWKAIAKFYKQNYENAEPRIVYSDDKP